MRKVFILLLILFFVLALPLSFIDKKIAFADEGNDDAAGTGSVEEGEGDSYSDRIETPGAPIEGPFDSGEADYYSEYCGNGYCGPGEDCNNCPGDCGGPCYQEYCGNGQCGSGENCDNCPNDCGGPECCRCAWEVYACKSCADSRYRWHEYRCNYNWCPGHGSGYCEQDTSCCDCGNCETFCCECFKDSDASCSGRDLLDCDGCYWVNKGQICGECGNPECCTSHAYYSCSDNDVYWFNSCGGREDMKQDCGDNYCEAWGGNYCKGI